MNEIGYLMNTDHKDSPMAIPNEKGHENALAIVVGKMLGHKVAYTYEYNDMMLPDPIDGTPREVQYIMYGPQDNIGIPYNEPLATFITSWGGSSDTFLRGRVFIMTKETNGEKLDVKTFQEAYTISKNRILDLEMGENVILSELKKGGYDVSILEDIVEDFFLHGKEPDLTRLKDLDIPLEALLDVLRMMNGDDEQ